MVSRLVAAALLAVLALPALAQIPVPPVVTYANRPTSGAARVVVISDCLDATCSAGSGSVALFAYWDGSTLDVIPDLTHVANASNLTAGTIPAARVGTDHLDAIAEIAAGLKSGADGTLVTGTAGSTNGVAAWNVDGDLVAEANGLTWNITTATCTGDGNGGALTVSGTEIVCSADDGGGGGGFTDIDTDYGDETVTSTWTFNDVGTGANGAYDLRLGVVAGSAYGGLQIGRTGIYSSAFSAGGMNLGGALLFRQEANIDVGNDPGIEFAWIEQGNTARLLIPESGAGNATAFIRSGTFAGPYSQVTGNDTVLCDTWTTYDSNIDCNTSGTGADLFVQDDLEVEGTIFAHESINFEGATADGNQVILQVGADPGADVTISLPTATGTLSLVNMPPIIYRPQQNEPPTANFATLDFRNSHPVLDFDDTTDETGIVTTLLPAEYAGGGLSCEVFWAATTSTTGDVVWNIAVEALASGGQDLDSDGFAAVNAATCTTSGTSGVLDECLITFTDGADMDSWAAGDPGRLKVTRDANNVADTMSGDAELKMVVCNET